MLCKRDAFRGALVAVLLTTGATAFAGVNVGIGIAVPGVVYTEPVPVYAPAPVYVAPQQLYVPAPVIVRPRYIGESRWRQDDDDDDDDDQGERNWRGRGDKGQHRGRHGGKHGRDD
jgi:hypothetical protein